VQVATTHTLAIHYVPVSTSATVKDRAKERVAWTTYYDGAKHGVMLPSGNADQPGAPAVVGELRANPVFNAPTDIVRGIDGPSLQARKGLLAQACSANSYPASVARYLDEAFYYVPVQLALALQRGGNYVEALDWFRAAYDYTAPPAQRRIHPLLVNEASRTDSYMRGPGWLLDPLNPHAALALRKDGNTRFVALCIAMRALRTRAAVREAARAAAEGASMRPRRRGGWPPPRRSRRWSRAKPAASPPGARGPSPTPRPIAPPAPRARWRARPSRRQLSWSPASRPRCWRVGICPGCAARPSIPGR
jgi:hypothetical protein